MDGFVVFCYGVAYLFLPVLFLCFIYFAILSLGVQARTPGYRGNLLRGIGLVVLTGLGLTFLTFPLIALLMRRDMLGTHMCLIPLIPGLGQWIYVPFELRSDLNESAPGRRAGILGASMILLAVSSLAAGFLCLLFFSVKGMPHS